MPLKLMVIFALILLYGKDSMSQTGKHQFPLKSMEGLEPVHVTLKAANYLGKQSVQVTDTAKGITSEVKYVKLKDISFHNGVIEVELAGKPSATAVETARGFVGIAFRISEDNSKFECIYLRPTNGRAPDQVRRNHSVQYISYPNLPWEKSRKETPEKYESYVDLVVGEWTKVKIEVEGEKATLYVHGQAQPTLLVNDLKHGATQSGSIGLWIGSGTEAYFRNLVITKKE
ncbi:hypothetical protein Q0590_14490 [Rhodocytophaga aerolata]|uniref:3-keto-alpha-glucoside-1,2-lyase/3-keto-2-hydroxy-glucal hydratase domain-containing protein n=1 Tax=Rhodocytophaga aerolata TaxID=455078 RepID=A0ABT8R888_9BACT|nr:family 16 glycoside hydrolase [Rhodocytophaga aerolata]MDO1447473.1 hypothetical protein [Rhodocytophaga aerolata]